MKLGYISIIDIVYYIMFICYIFLLHNHAALENQQEITVKVFLKMVSVALQLAFFLFDLLNLVGW